MYDYRLWVDEAGGCWTAQALLDGKIAAQVDATGDVGDSWAFDSRSGAPHLTDELDAILETVLTDVTDDRDPGFGRDLIEYARVLDTIRRKVRHDPTTDVGADLVRLGGWLTDLGNSLTP